VLALAGAALPLARTEDGFGLEEDGGDDWGENSGQGG